MQQVTAINQTMYTDPKYAQSELIPIIEEWYNTEPSKYKANIYQFYRQHKMKPIDLVTAFNISINTAKSYICASHPARIEFITALKLAEFMGVDLKYFLI